ncbi:MAG: oligosaccharide flippase family protein [Selenomonadaceae bacterium]|nr:oligosaccharide flippase family protein [Selenomonadaceae bacterium]
MNQRKIGVLLSYGNIIATIVVNLLYTPVMLRLVGPNAYGVYSISNSVIGYFALLYTGMTSTYLNYYAGYKKREDHQAIARLNSLFLILFSVLGLLALVLGFVVSFNLESVLGDGLTVEEYQLAHQLFIIMSLNMALLMPKTVFATLVVSQERFIFIKGLSLVDTILMPLLVLPNLYMGVGVIGISIVVLLLTAVDLFVNIFYCLKCLKCQFCFTKIPFFLLSGMLSFSIYIILQGIMDQFNWQLAKLLLSNFADTKAIAVYSVGMQFSMLYISFASAFSGVVVPQIYELVSRGDKTALNKLWIKVGRYQFFVTYFILLGFILWGKEFIQLWAGDVYADAYWVAVLLMAPLVLHLPQMTGVEILRAYNKHARWVIVHLVFAIAGFGLCIPLTKAYGVLGVSFGCSITMFIVANIYDNWYYYKVVCLDVKAFFIEMSKLLPAILITAIGGYAISKCFLVNAWRDFALVSLTFMLLYATSMFFFGMNSQEKEQVKALILSRRR